MYVPYVDDFDGVVFLTTAILTAGIIGAAVMEYMRSGMAESHEDVYQDDIEEPSGEEPTIAYTFTFHNSAHPTTRVLEGISEYESDCPNLLCFGFILVCQIIVLCAC